MASMSVEYLFYPLACKFQRVLSDFSYLSLVYGFHDVMELTISLSLLAVFETATISVVNIDRNFL